MAAPSVFSPVSALVPRFSPARLTPAMRHSISFVAVRTETLRGLRLDGKLETLRRLCCVVGSGVRLTPFWFDQMASAG